MNMRPFKIALIAFIAVAARAADFDYAAALNQTGLDLYRQLAKSESGNLVLSPYSIDSALSLVYAGADGATRSELATALHLPADEASIGTAAKKLRADLTTAASSTDSEIELLSANRLFGQAGYSFRPEYLKLTQETYAAPFEKHDFVHAAEAARGTINSWVASQTHDRIKDLLPRGSLTDATRLVLVNALYFKAPWAEPFKRSQTKQRPFHVRPSQETPVLTMQHTDFYGYAHENGYEVVTLDYRGGAFQFVIVLPEEGSTPDAVAAKLTPADFARWAQLGHQIRPTEVGLYLPKFTLKNPTLPLGSALRGLGAIQVFDEPNGSADLTRIAPKRLNDYLYLSEVFHRTFIALDEETTEAAAATGGIVLSTLAVTVSRPIVVHVDRPFLCAIQHRASGACLFFGRIADPR